MDLTFESNITESLNGQTCHGCLCNDRKITVLSNGLNKQCFLQIIREISSPQSNEATVQLCWECEAYVWRFVKFKAQAQKSMKLLSNVAAVEVVKVHQPTAELLQPENTPITVALKILNEVAKEVDLFHCVLTEFTEGCTDYLSKISLQSPQRLSNLQNHTLYNINILPSLKETEFTEYKIVKTEETSTDIVKEEIVEGVEDVLEYSDTYSDEDNKLLIDFSRKKKLSNGQSVKKRRKKKKDEKVTLKTELAFYTEIELTKDDIVEERRALESREDYVNALFRCEHCLLSFPNVHDLKDHVRNKHEMHAASKHKCDICECTFGSDVAFNYHMNKHTRRFQCSVCDMRFGSKSAVTKHYQVMHCDSIDKEYETSMETVENGKTEALDNSIKQSEATFSCEFCDKSFKWKTSLRKHAETHRIESGQKRRPYCEPCRLSFTSTSTLQNHVKTSSKHQIQLKLRKLKDTLSESTPTEKEQARIEEIRMKVNNERKVYPCAQCDKKFQWKGNLLRHIDSHAAKANGELVCKPCNRTFSSIATFKQHMKISKKHVSENDFNYMCSDCGKRFANKTRLRDHIDWDHLKNYVHKCQICQKVFKTHTSLYLHKQVVHRNSAEHLCDHCGKPFPNRTKLRSHILALHTSGAAYSCSKCDARFNWHSCLSRHMRRVHKSRDDKAGVNNGGSA